MITSSKARSSEESGPAIVGNRRGTRSGSGHVAISYPELDQMATLLCHTLCRLLDLEHVTTVVCSPNQSSSSLALSSSSLYSCPAPAAVLIIGVAIPSSSPLFALCCHALYTTHDRERHPAPLVLAPLDTEDPTARSKHLLACLQGHGNNNNNNNNNNNRRRMMMPDVEGAEGGRLAAILTVGSHSVSHWRQLLGDDNKDKDKDSDSEDSCVVMDVEECIRQSAELSAGEKRQWLWDDEDDGLSGGVQSGNQYVDMSMWEEEGEKKEEEEKEEEEGEDDGVCVLPTGLLTPEDQLAQGQERRKGGESKGSWSRAGGNVPVSVSVPCLSGSSSGDATGSSSRVDVCSPTSSSLAHIAFTSGSSTGAPKGCCASLRALEHYCDSKNEAHGISATSAVLLVSAATFDPALSDVIATFRAGATLVLATRTELQAQVGAVIQAFGVTHLLGTPSWFLHTDLMQDLSSDLSGPGSGSGPGPGLASLQVIALGGEDIPHRIRQKWARRRPPLTLPGLDSSISSGATGAGAGEKRGDEGENPLPHSHSRSCSHVRLCATYGVTEACVYQTFGEVFQHEEGEGEGRDPRSGSCVGVALSSINIRICTEVPVSSSESPPLSSFSSSPRGNSLQHVQMREVQGSSNNSRDSNGGDSSDSTDEQAQGIGEIVLEGSQIDHLSGYYNCHHRRQDASITSTIPSSSSSSSPFVLSTWADGTTSVCYRTGDRGYLSSPVPAPHSLITTDTGTNTDTNTDTGTGILRELYLLGRMAAAPRLIKCNGIRVDPREVEACLLEEYSDEHSWTQLSINALSPLIRDCAVVFASGPARIVAYCVLSFEAISELRFDSTLLDSGVLCPPGPLLTLLRMRCVRHLKRGVAPAVFVFIRKVPLTSSGKRCLAGLPAVAQCQAAVAPHAGSSSSVDSRDSSRDSSGGSSRGCLLVECGGAGPAVAAEIIACLNLQPCQQSSVTTKATFAMLGCDSLAVTRIVRALYAANHGIFNSRTLGGKFGALDEHGPFAVRHVFEARDLGEYVSWLDRHQLCQCQGQCQQSSSASPASLGDGEGNADGGSDRGSSMSLNELLTTSPSEQDHPLHMHSAFQDDAVLYDSLLEAISLNHPRLALSLLALGVNPALSEHGGRIAKVSGRMAMRKWFKSNPLHISCQRGQPVLVKALLLLGHSCKSPDANGSFPIHLVCSKLNEIEEEEEEGNRESANSVVNSDIDDANRVECLQLLLEHGKVPLTIKDKNKQTILHCVSRTGSPLLTQFVISLWREGGQTGVVPCSYAPDGGGDGGIWDWRDRWGRTPVHWAVLNGHVATLRLLLNAGCRPDPPRVRCSARNTSAENETPREMCERLYLCQHAPSPLPIRVHPDISTSTPITISAERQEVGRAILALLSQH